MLGRGILDSLNPSSKYPCILTPDTATLAGGRGVRGGRDRVCIGCKIFPQTEGNPFFNG